MLTPVLATLVYVLSPDGERVLMVHRNKRADDLHFGKYNGLGGKVEPDEDVVNCAAREVAEESGLAVTRLCLRGTVSWPGFGAGGQDWFGFVFRVDAFTGVAYESNEDGPLEWIPLSALPSLPTWESDHEWLPMVFDADPRCFHGVMPYQNGEMVSWSYHRI